MTEISSHLRAQLEWFAFKHKLYLEDWEGPFYSIDFPQEGAFHHFEFPVVNYYGVRVSVELSFMPPYLLPFRLGWDEPIIRDL